MFEFYYHPHAGYDKNGNWVTGNEWIGTNDDREAYINGTMIISGWQYKNIFSKENK